MGKQQRRNEFQSIFLQKLKYCSRIPEKIYNSAVDLIGCLRTRKGRKTGNSKLYEIHFKIMSEKLVNLSKRCKCFHREILGRSFISLYNIFGLLLSAAHSLDWFYISGKEKEKEEKSELRISC